MSSNLPVILITASSALIVFALGVIAGWLLCRFSEAKTVLESDSGRKREGLGRQRDIEIDNEAGIGIGNVIQAEVKSARKEKMVIESDVPLLFDARSMEPDRRAIDLAQRSGDTIVHSPRSTRRSSVPSDLSRSPISNRSGGAKTKLSKEGRRLLRKHLRYSEEAQLYDNRGIDVQGYNEVELAVDEDDVQDSPQQNHHHHHLRQPLIARSKTPAPQRHSSPIFTLPYLLPLSRRPSSSNYSQLSPELDRHTLTSTSTSSDCYRLSQEMKQQERLSLQSRFSPRQPRSKLVGNGGTGASGTGGGSRRYFRDARSISDDIVPIPASPKSALPSLVPAMSNVGGGMATTTALVDRPRPASLSLTLNRSRLSPRSTSLRSPIISMHYSSSSPTSTSAERRSTVPLNGSLTAKKVAGGKPPLPQKSPTRSRIRDGVPRDQDGLQYVGDPINKLYSDVGDDLHVAPIRLWGGERRDLSGTIDELKLQHSRVRLSLLHVANPDAIDRI